jgi:transcriptional regulator GlxA family with amidase domain
MDKAVATPDRSSKDRADSKPKLSVGFVLADNFTLSAFALFVDHLRLAADEGDRSRPILCRWSIMGASSSDCSAP